jgi:hypothetical protein
VFWNMDAEEIRMLAPQFDCGESWMNKSAYPRQLLKFLAPCWFLDKTTMYATTLWAK